MARREPGVATCRECRGGKKISKATQQVYTPGPSDLGKKLSVKVTGRLAGYNTVAKISAPTVKVIVIA